MDIKKCMEYQLKIEEILESEPDSEMKIAVLGSCVNWIISNLENPVLEKNKFIKKLQGMPLF